MLIDFLTNPLWEQIITSAPYNVIVKWDGDYCLLKYNMFASDLSNDIVQQCRGTVLHKNHDGSMSICCMPFYKFFNYGEEFAHDIDWASAVVMEKVDGSLINVWYHNGWHMSTSGCVDAFKTYQDSNGACFGELFVNCVGGSWFDFCRNLDPRFTYMFELTTSQNRIVVRYTDDAVWFLGKRNIYTMEEDAVPPNIDCLKIPKVYNLSSLDDCIASAAALGDNAEGFVVRDKNWHRIKVKNPAWLAASKLHNNGNITAKTVIEMYREGKIDDYLGTFPEDKERVNFYLTPLLNYIEALDNAWNFNIKLQDVINSDSPYRNYLFGRIKGKWWNGTEYVNQLTVPALIRQLGYAK